MKNSIFALAITGLIAAACGTSGQYASSRFDDAIYSGTENKVYVSATDSRLQDLKNRTAETSTLIVNGKKAQVVYMDENKTVDIPVNIDEENTYLVIDESISYEELLRKFDSPDYTINLHIESRWDDWDYYRPWMWGYNPWSWRYYSRFHRPWSFYSAYPYYWRDPFFYDIYYSYGAYYDPWNPYWYYGGHYPIYNYYGNYGYSPYNGYSDPYYYYYTDSNYQYQNSNRIRGKVYGKRVTDNRQGGTADNRERAVITSIPRQATSATRSTTRGNEQSTSTPVTNSIYRRGNSSGQGISYGEGTVNSRERSTTYNRSNQGRSNSTEREQSTGTFRRSTATNPVVTRSSSNESGRGNSYERNNSSRERDNRSYERSNSVNNSSSYTRSETSATRSASGSSSSSAGRSSSGTSTGTSNSSGSGYRR